MTIETQDILTMSGSARGPGGAMLGRRSLLRGALAGATTLAVGAPLGGCADTPTPRAAERPGAAPSPTGSAPPAASAPVGATVTTSTTTPTGPTMATSGATPVGGAVGGPAATATVAVGSGGRPVAATPARVRILLAYFSRAGENYFNGGRIRLDVGNTEVLVGLIRQRIACDVYRIEAADPYPDDYEETVARNVREQESDARPAIAGPLPALDGYDTVLLGSPIWNVRPPQIMATFAEGLDLAGKRVFPFVTYAVSGLGNAARDYAAWCPGATLGEGLAVRGEEVRDGGPAAEAWLRRIGLLAG